MSEWLQRPYLPVPIDDVKLIFPGEVKFLMPDPETIPDDYGRPSHPLYKAIQTFVFTGVAPAELEFDARLDLDYEVAARHLLAIRGSFQPRHEEKMKVLVYLFALWFPNLRAPEVQEGQ